jgi:hypothetical protein
MKKIFLLCIAPAILSAATEYFPTDTGNTWTFSYVSSSSPVVPDPLVTRDSGTIKWEALRALGNGIAVYFRFKQTRSLVRRTVSGGGSPGYDSLFSSPRMTMDTVILSRPVVLIDSLDLRDSLENGLAFSNAACPAAVHDFLKPVPSTMTVTDTTVQFDGSAYACKKITPSECSCYKYFLWSFVLADRVGPVGAHITLCPGYVGGAYSETWRLVFREYPPVAAQSRPSFGPKGACMTILYGSNSIILRFSSGSSHPLSAAVYRLSGREVKRFPGESGSALVWNTGSVPAGMYLVRARFENGTIARRIWLHK